MNIWLSPRDEPHRILTSSQRHLIHNDGIALIERNCICADVEVDSKAPGEVLFVVLRGDHQVVGTWRNAGEGGFAGDVGADGGGSV